MKARIRIERNPYTRNWEGWITAGHVTINFATAPDKPTVKARLKAAKEQIKEIITDTVEEWDEEI